MARSIFARPSSATLAGQGGATVPTTNGTRRSLTAAQLRHLLASNTAPADVLLALAKVRRSLPLNQYDIDVCVDYVTQAATHLQ